MKTKSFHRTQKHPENITNNLCVYKRVHIAIPLIMHIMCIEKPLICTLHFKFKLQRAFEFRWLFNVDVKSLFHFELWIVNNWILFQLKTIQLKLWRCSLTYVYSAAKHRNGKIFHFCLEWSQPIHGYSHSINSIFLCQRLCQFQRCLFVCKNFEAHFKQINFKLLDPNQTRVHFFASKPSISVIYTNYTAPFSLRLQQNERKKSNELKCEISLIINFFLGAFQRRLSRLTSTFLKLLLSGFSLRSHYLIVWHWIKCLWILIKMRNGACVFHVGALIQIKKKRSSDYGVWRTTNSNKIK